MKMKLLATAAAMMIAGNAQAAIVSFSTPIPVPQTQDGVYINFATGATGTSEFAGWDFNPYVNGGEFLFFWGGQQSPNNGGVADATGKYLALAPGAVISAASTFSQVANNAIVTAEFHATGIHTLGFRFQNETTNAVNYGFLRMQTNGPNGLPATILGWSFDNSGAAITVQEQAPEVPEPSSWAMMIGGFGLAGATLRRRARTARVAFA
jgi:hypothetical protein